MTLSTFPQLTREKSFAGSFIASTTSKYRRAFSIEEIERSLTLKWAFGAIVLSFFVFFLLTSGNPTITRTAYLTNRFLCWPYFQDCGQLYFLETLPEGYSLPILYMVVFSVIVLIVYLMVRGLWDLAHFLLLILWVVKVLLTFVITMRYNGNFEYYDIVLSFVLLFLPEKKFFLKVTFVFLYFLAATIKIHPGWILGTYFTSLKTGLPVFGDAIAPIVTNFVIFEQIVGCWLLLSRRPLYQRLTVAYCTIFHIYSGILVFYRYPISVIPILLVLFGPRYKYSPPPFTKKAVGGWLFLVLLICIQLSSKLIPGDTKLTLEGNYYGLYMFEANHQCISARQTYRGDAVIDTVRRESISARNRCDPYEAFFSIKQVCERSGPGIRIEWTFDHSINGGPFYRIVDTKNVCQLRYKAFGHNEWIATEHDDPKIIGYPVKNIFR